MQILGIFFLIVLSFTNTTTTVMFVNTPEVAIITCKIFIVLNFPESSSLFMTLVIFSCHIVRQCADQGTFDATAGLNSANCRNFSQFRRFKESFENW